MDIHLYNSEVLALTGSKLKSMIMNNNMPILDLLVRESLQNSLDAQNSKNPSPSVNVEFKTGSFNAEELGMHLSKITF